MLAWPDGVSITVEIAFASAPLATSPTYTDVTAWVKAPMRISHGTTSEDGETSTPSNLSITFKNRDRRFDPDHATGPYYGSLVPRKRIRVTATLGVFSAVIFTGWVKGWPQQYERRFDATVTVSAVSSVALLNSEELPASAYARQVNLSSPTVYYPLQDSLSPADGYGSQDFALSPATDSADSISYITQAAPIGQAQMAQMVAPSTAGNMLVPTSLGSLPTAVEAWIYTSSTSPAQVGAVVNGTTWLQVGLDTSGNLRAWYSSGSENLSIPNNTLVRSVGAGLHHIVMTRSGSTLSWYVDGSPMGSAALVAGTTTPTIDESLAGYWLKYGTAPNNDAAISHFAAYAANLTAATVSDHYGAGKYAYTGAHGVYGFEFGGARIGRILDDVSWPSNLRDLDTGGTRHAAYLPAGGNPVAAMQDVARGEAGVLFNDTQGRVAFADRQTLWTAAAAATFSDDGAVNAVKYRDITSDGNTDETIRNIISSTDDTGATIRQRDQTSVDAYGAAKQDDSTPTLTTPDATNRTAYVLRNKKDPTTRITRLVVPIRPRPNGTDLTVQVTKTLARQIADIVDVEGTPMGVGAQVVKRSMILGIAHDIDRDRWDVTLYLTPAPTAATVAPYLILGDATYGRIGAAAGNKIPY